LSLIFYGTKTGKGKQQTLTSINTPVALEVFERKFAPIYLFVRHLWKKALISQSLKNRLKLAQYA
jgi:hypothetical protein